MRTPDGRYINPPVTPTQACEAIWSKMKHNELINADGLARCAEVQPIAAAFFLQKKFAQGAADVVDRHWFGHPGSATYFGEERQKITTED